MDSNVVRVLLVAQSVQGFSFLQTRLQRQGCQCLFASSGCEAARIARESPCDLVLCVHGTAGFDALTAALIGTSSTLYCSHLLDDGCVWWPAVLLGAKGLAGPAIRPSEFAIVLDGIVQQARLRSARPGAPEPHANLPSHA